ALAAIGWWWTVRQMRGMDEGPWTGLGTLGWFLGIWVVMMAAMMFPSVAPTVALYSRMTRQRSPLSPLLFAAGYLVTWAGAGLVALGVMSVAWMAFVAGLIAVEKTLPWRRVATYGTAVLLLVLGVLLFVAPDVIPALTVPDSGPMNGLQPMRP